MEQENGCSYAKLTNIGSTNIGVVSLHLQNNYPLMLMFSISKNVLPTFVYMLLVLFHNKQVRHTIWRPSVGFTKLDHYYVKTSLNSQSQSQSVILRCNLTGAFPPNLSLDFFFRGTSYMLMKNYYSQTKYVFLPKKHAYDKRYSNTSLKNTSK